MNCGIKSWLLHYCQPDRLVINSLCLQKFKIVYSQNAHVHVSPSYREAYDDKSSAVRSPHKTDSRPALHEHANGIVFKPAISQQQDQSRQVYHTTAERVDKNPTSRAKSREDGCASNYQDHSQRYGSPSVEVKPVAPAGRALPQEPQHGISHEHVTLFVRLCLYYYLKQLCVKQYKKSSTVNQNSCSIKSLALMLKLPL